MSHKMDYYKAADDAELQDTIEDLANRNRLSKWEQDFYEHINTLDELSETQREKAVQIIIERG